MLLALDLKNPNHVDLAEYLYDLTCASISDSTLGNNLGKLASHKKRWGSGEEISIVWLCLMCMHQAAALSSTLPRTHVAVLYATVPTDLEVLHYSKVLLRKVGGLLWETEKETAAWMKIRTEFFIRISTRENHVFNHLSEINVSKQKFHNSVCSFAIVPRRNIFKSCVSNTSCMSKE